MGDENPIRTLGDYSKPSHEGYRNPIELPIGNNVVPLRSDTIRLVQNRWSFHGLRFEDPNQHLKDFLKLVDSLDLDGSITTWEDLTTRFLAQFFPSRRTTKLRNDILMFQQHHGEYLSKAWTHFKDLLQTNDPTDFAKPVKEIGLPQDVPNTSDRRLIELENQVQRLMEAHLALTQPTQVNKITFSCEICSGPHDTQYCMENPEQALVEYASSRTDEAREGLVSNFIASQDARLSKFEADFKQQQSEMTNKIDTVLKAITDRIAGALPSNTNNESDGEDQEEMSNPKNIDTTPHSPHDPSILFITKKVRKLNSFLESSGWVPQSFNTEIVCTKGDDEEVMFIEIIITNDDSREEGPDDKGSTTNQRVRSRIF
ncbi:MAK10-like protein [Tanacetum coccineum]